MSEILAPPTQPIVTYPSKHWLLYSDSGAGKSTMAATYPKPMLVWMFDPFGKDEPYLKGAVPGGIGELQQYPLNITGLGESMITYRDVQHPDGMIRIEYYHDVNIKAPTAYMRFQTRFDVLLPGEMTVWKTVTLDSVTFMEKLARKWDQYVLNPTAKDPRKWFGASTDLLEEMLMLRFAGLPMNVVVIAHIDQEKDDVHGTFVRNPSAPGRLRRDLSTAFSEIYRLYIGRDEKGGEEFYAAQTRTDNMFNAQTHINAPNPCYPAYSSLWVNYGK